MLGIRRGMRGVEQSETAFDLSAYLRIVTGQVQKLSSWPETISRYRSRNGLLAERRFRFGPKPSRFARLPLHPKANAKHSSATRLRRATFPRKGGRIALVIFDVAVKSERSPSLLFIPLTAQSSSPSLRPTTRCPALRCRALAGARVWRTHPNRRPTPRRDTTWESSSERRARRDRAPWPRY
jgi:hypothetical protein